MPPSLQTHAFSSVWLYFSALEKPSKEDPQSSSVQRCVLFSFSRLDRVSAAPPQQAPPALSRQVQSLSRRGHSGALPAHAGALPARTAPITAIGLSLRDAALSQPPAGAGRARERRCEGRAGSGHGHGHSLRGDVEADIPVLPQHVQYSAHGRHPPRGVRAPPWQRDGWVVPRAPAAAAIGCGERARTGARPGSSPGSAEAPKSET